MLAQVAPENEWKSKEATSNIANICPTNTVQVVRVTWAGGVSRPDGQPVGELDRQAYRIRIGGNEIVPFALADLNDNHDVCLKEAGQPELVSFLAGLLVDLAGDRNPATRIFLP